MRAKSPNSGVHAAKVSPKSPTCIEAKGEGLDERTIWILSSILNHREDFPVGIRLSGMVSCDLPHSKLVGAEPRLSWSGALKSWVTKVVVCLSNALRGGK